MKNWTSLCPPLTTYFQYVSRNNYYDNFLIASVIVNAVIAVLSFLSNLVVIVTILRNRRLQTPSNILLVGLAVSDVCTSILALPSYSLYKLFEYLRSTGPFCIFGMIYITSGTTLAIISFLTLTAVTGDRYIAIILHLRYQEVATPKRYAITLAVIWLVCVSAVVIRMFAFGVIFLLLASLAFAFLLLLNGFFIARISKIIKRHSRQIQAQQQSVQQSIDMPRYKKSVNTMYYVIGAFILCYVPFGIVLFVIYLIPEFSLGIRTSFSVAETLVLLNGALNPIIYSWRIKELRDTCIEMLAKLGLTRRIQ